MKTSKANGLILLLLGIGTGIMAYPSFMNLSAVWKQQTVIAGYDGMLSSRNAEEIQKEKEEAEKYNQKIRSIQQAKAFCYSPEDPEDTEYTNVLNEGDEDRTMALLLIPEINVSIPVVHGTDEEKLKYEAGHMYGTSLPVGGESTHCVIAGHTGLVNARLFTDLEKLETGDSFSLIVVNEKHTYTIDRILTVLPEEESCYLQIEDGMDYVTLYTCTPYGVNDHRLLVRGVRSFDQTDCLDQDELIITDHSVLIRMVFLVLLPVLLVFMGLLRLVSAK